MRRFLRTAVARCALIFVFAALCFAAPHAAYADGGIDLGGAGGSGVSAPAPGGGYGTSDPGVQSAAADYDHALLNKIQNAFAAPASRLAASARDVATGIFGALLTVELAWYTILLLKRQHDVADIATNAGFKLTSLGFMIALFTNSNTGLNWTNAIIQTFTGAGQQITHLTLTPSDIMSDGIDFIAQLSSANPQIGAQGIGHIPFDIANSIVPGLVLLLAMLAIMVSFGLITFMLLMFQIESVVAIPVVVFQLAFLGSRWSLPWAQGAISYLVNLGVRIMTLGIVVSLGLSVLQDGLQALINSGPPNAMLPPPIYFVIAMAALVFAGICVAIPRMAASAMTGNPTMSVGTLFAGSALLAAGARAAASTPLQATNLAMRTGSAGVGIAAGTARALGGANIGGVSALARGAEPMLRQMKTAHATSARSLGGGKANGTFAAIRRVAPPKNPVDDSGSGGATVRIGHHE